MYSSKCQQKDLVENSICETELEINSNNVNSFCRFY